MAKRKKKKKQTEAKSKALPTEKRKSKQAEKPATSAPEADDPKRRRLKALTLFGLTALPLLLFWFFKGFQTMPVTGDEHIYFYVGRRMADGLLPYRDIFSAHPPLHLVIAMLWMLPGWYAPFWQSFATILPASITLIFTILLLYKAKAPKIVVLVLGSALALSHDFLTVSAHFTGANWSLAMLVVGMWALLEKRRVTAGALLAAALLISPHVLPMAFAALLFDLAAYKKAAWRSALGFFSLFIGVQLLFLLLTGSAYIEQVYGYHLMKTAMASGGGQAVIRFFYNEYHLASLALFGAVKGLTPILKHWRPKTALPKEYALPALSALLLLAQISALFVIDRVFTYYLSPLLPFFILMSLPIAVAAWAWLKTLGQRLFAKKDAPLKLGKAIAMIAAFSLLLVLGERLERGMGYFQRSYGEISSYQWRDSPFYPDWVNEITRSLFFSEQRRVGDIDNGIKRYFWHESVSEDPTPLLRYLQQERLPQGRIFGDSTSVPYFANALSRLISFEMADTNAQIFKSGVRDIAETIQKLEEAPPAIVITRKRRGIGSNPLFQQFIMRHYRLAEHVRTTKNKSLYLWLPK